MNPLECLSACAGHWQGTNRLHLSPDCAADESPSALNITSILGGRFVRNDQTWSAQGKSQEGSLLVGYDPLSKVATGHWIDTFHNGRGVMACRGTIGDDGVVDLRGGYAAPPGPDWVWRVKLVPNAPESIEILMYNVTPEGQEALAVRATHSPA